MKINFFIAKTASGIIAALILFLKVKSAPAAVRALKLSEAQ